MQRFDYYLQIVPLPVLILAPLLGMAAFLMVPRALRLPAALAFMVPWLLLSFFSELGPIQAVAKATSFAVYPVIILAALLHPGPRRKLHPILWVYPIMAFVSIAYVVTVEDRTLAVALRVQWVLLTLSVLAVVRTITDERSLRMVLGGIAAGVAIATLMAFSQLLISPGKAFASGLGRFEPYGVNSNQVGIVFAMTMVLWSYLAVKGTVSIRIFAVGVVALALGLALLTGSRSSLVVGIVPMIPVALSLARRPIFGVVGVALAVVAISFIIGMAERTAFGRLTTFETNRFKIFGEYLSIIATRPVFGLMGTQGQHHFHDPNLGAHPHNAYLQMLWLGGLSYAVPMIGMGVYTLWCALRVIQRRAWFAIDRLLLIVLAALIVITYANGFESSVNYHPTYSWAFLHILVSCIFVSLASDAAAARRRGVVHDVEEEWDWADDEDYLDPVEQDAN